MWTKEQKREYLRQYRIRNKDRLNEARREWYRENREEHLAKGRALYAASLPKQHARSKAYRASHKAQGKAYAQAYAKAHPEVGAKKTARYRETHSAKVDSYDRQYKRSLRGRYGHLMSSAKSRGLACAVSLAEYARLVAQPCRYCGGPLNASGHGLDRVDNAEGYTLTNSVPCCRVCNHAKRDMTLQDFIAWAHRVVHHLDPSPNPLS